MPTEQDRLRKVVEGSVRHARMNVGYTINNYAAAEINISMDVETIMAAVQAHTNQLLDRVEQEAPNNVYTISAHDKSIGIIQTNDAWRKAISKLREDYNARD
jgi:hypothetical protein